MDLSLKSPTPDHVKAIIHEQAAEEAGPFKIIGEIAVEPGTQQLAIRTEPALWNRLAFRHQDGTIYGHSEPFLSPEVRPEFELTTAAFLQGERKYVGGRLLRAIAAPQEVSAALFLTERPLTALVATVTPDGEDTVVHAMVDAMTLVAEQPYRIRWVYEPAEGDTAEGWQPLAIMSAEAVPEDQAEGITPD